MNWNKIFTLCACVLLFCAVCTACNNAAGGKPQKPVDSQKPAESQNPADPKNPTESPSPDLSIPEGIAEKTFSELPAEQQTEIKSLYGYYWAQNGSRAECPAIDADRLAVYTGQPGMSIGFTNLRWSRVSSSKWICFAYGEDDFDYATRRIIFTFVKDGNGTVKLFDKIILMGKTFGPYIKGKEPEKVIEGGKMYYRYDTKSPKLVEPTLK